MVKTMVKKPWYQRLSKASQVIQRSRKSREVPQKGSLNERFQHFRDGGNPWLKKKVKQKEYGYNYIIIYIWIYYIYIYMDIYILISIHMAIHYKKKQASSRVCFASFHEFTFWRCWLTDAHNVSYSFALENGPVTRRQTHGYPQFWCITIFPVNLPWYGPF